MWCCFTKGISDSESIIIYNKPINKVKPEKKMPKKPEKLKK